MQTRRAPAYALATILILLGVALFGVGAIITISTLESKISRSQKEGIGAYYVAEAGVQDVIWKANNDVTFAEELIGGTINRSYSVNVTDGADSAVTCDDDIPQFKQVFSAHVYTAPQGAGYAIAEVTGCVDNGDFTAKRRIKTTLFQNTIVPPTGMNSVFSGGDIRITNNNTTVNASGGNFYAKSSINGSIAINSGANVNLCYNTSPCTTSFVTPGRFSIASGNVIGGVQDNTSVPVPEAITPPGFDFSYYGQPGNSTVSYTASDFTNMVRNAPGGILTLPGPITYVSGSVSLTNAIARNRTINITGMLVINGSFTTGGSISNLYINVADPGNGKAGIFAQSMSISAGNMDIDGVLYASGSMDFTNTNPISIDGGLVAGTGVKMNTGTLLTIVFNATRMYAPFGAGRPTAVEVRHWEEEY